MTILFEMKTFQAFLNKKINISDFNNQHNNFYLTNNFFTAILDRHTKNSFCDKSWGLVNLYLQEQTSFLINKKTWPSTVKTGWRQAGGGVGGQHWAYLLQHVRLQKRNNNQIMLHKTR